MKRITAALVLSVICFASIGLTAVFASTVYHTKNGIVHGCPDTWGCSDGDPVGNGKRQGKSHRNGHTEDGVYIFGLSKATVGVYLNGTTTTPSNWVAMCTNCNNNKICVGTGCNTGTAGAIARECDYNTQHTATADTGNSINHRMYTLAYYNGDC